MALSDRIMSIVAERVEYARVNGPKNMLLIAIADIQEFNVFIDSYLAHCGRNNIIKDRMSDPTYARFVNIEFKDELKFSFLRFSPRMDLDYIENQTKEFIRNFRFTFSGVEVYNGSIGERQFMPAFDKELTAEYNRMIIDEQSFTG